MIINMSIGESPIKQYEDMGGSKMLDVRSKNWLRDTLYVHEDAGNCTVACAKYIL